MPTNPDWNGLRARLDGEVVRPGTAAYHCLRRPALARFGASRPDAVVLATTDADAGEAVRFARQCGQRIRPRSGGHCFAGRSSGAGMVLDVTALRSVNVGDATVVVGAGARLGDLDDALGSRTLALPTGCGRSVGVAGLTLGGGLGLLGRRHGLTCDHLLGARVVLADGSVTDCDAAHDPELYWALRGAGGGQFGVVTSLTFSTVAAPVVTCFRLGWAATHCAAVLQAWQSWAPTAPDHITAELRLTVTGRNGQPPRVEVLGVVIHSDPPRASDAGPLDELIARAGNAPAAQSRRVLPYHEAKRQLASSTGAEAHREEIEFSKSEFFRRPLPGPGVACLLAHLTLACPPGQTRQLSITPWGGAYNRVSSDRTAFAHRDELFLLEHVVRVGANVTTKAQLQARAWLRRSWAAVHPFASGRVYPNFPDTELTDWAHAYHGSNIDRLVEAKRRYDPDCVFRFRQSLASLIHRPR